MKIPLIESFNSWPDEGSPIVMPKLPLTEGTLVEADGQSYHPLGGREVPIWRLDKKNLNKRIYTTKLANKVVRENKVTLALKDHPKGNEDSSVDRVVAVGKNPHIREGILWADCYFVDEDFALKVERIIEVGGMIGLSSSAYGEVSKDGEVLDEDFVLERFFDFVTSPSYEVYLTKEAAPVGVTESVIPTQETLTNKQEKVREASSTGDSMSRDITALVERNFKINVRKMWEKADKASEVAQKIEILESIKEYCSDLEMDFADEQRKKAEETIVAVKEAAIQADRKKLEEAVETTVAEKTSIEERLAAIEEEHAQIVEEYEFALDTIAKLTKKDAKLKKMLELAKDEKATMVNAAELKETVEYIETLEKKIEVAKADNTKLKAAFSEIVERYGKALARKQKAELTLAIRDSIAVPMDEAMMGPEMETEEEVEDRYFDPELDDMDGPDLVDLYGPKKSQNGLDLPEDDIEDELNYQVNKGINISGPRAHDDYEYPYDESIDFRDEKAILALYEDYVNENPKVKMIKDVLLKCKTITEMQDTYNKLEPLLERAHSKASAQPNLKEAVREAATSRIQEPSLTNLLRNRKGWK